MEVAEVSWSGNYSKLSLLISNQWPFILPNNVHYYFYQDTNWLLLWPTTANLVFYRLCHTKTQKKSATSIITKTLLLVSYFLVFSLLYHALLTNFVLRIKDCDHYMKWLYPIVKWNGVNNHKNLRADWTIKGLHWGLASIRNPQQVYDSSVK